jgi:lipoprotein-anchoring transpeptidase ErfK/SrfK
MRVIATSVFLLFFVSGVMAAERLDMQAVNDAKPAPRGVSETSLNPAIVKAQVLLDRARFSPGEIDGKAGENFQKALKAFETEQGLPTTGKLNDETWQRLSATSSSPVLVQYTLSQDDVRGPFVENLPQKMEEMKDLPALGYSSPQEKLAEKFHMSQELLSILNPGETFETAGRAIVIAGTGAGDLPEKVDRIEIDKTHQTLKVFGRDQKLLAVYPATVGSTEKPAPSGRLTVRSISKNPTYRYNPDYAFKGVRSAKPFTIKPGPNNPVGLVWIGLSPGEGFGIHGTPDPSKVSKSESHGCVRLTNWDALRLASALSKGVKVEFFGDERDRKNSRDRRINRRDAKRRG